MKKFDEVKKLMDLERKRLKDAQKRLRAEFVPVESIDSKAKGE